MNPNDEQMPDKELRATIKNELERESATLDELTVARLRAARLRALEAATTGPWYVGWQPAASVSLAVALLLGALLLWVQPATPTPDEALAMMSTLDEGMELYENLEFYEWLEAQADEERV